MTLKVGVVGVGQRSGIAHHVATSGIDASVTVVSDPSQAGRARGQSMFPGAATFATHRELIAAEALDAAIVTSPDWTHAEIACDLLEAGIAVYLEKPMAITTEDADRVLAASARTGTPLYVGHNFRHSALVRALAAVIQRGEIGDVTAVWCRHFVGNGGDYYFKDWHAERSKVGSLLLQKASHDLDVIHYLAGSYTRRVSAMGRLAIYGDIGDRREAGDALMPEWFSYDNWPPRSQTALNPVVDVEDLSMVHLELGNGVLASYEQCHFTPDYWRNYTIIGTEGRVENFGDTGGGVVKVWNRRRTWSAEGDREYRLDGVAEGHDDADQLTMREFLLYVSAGEKPTLSPVAAREAVAAGDYATRSLRSGSVPLDIPAVPAEILSKLP